MKVVISGSRGIDDAELVEESIENAGFDIDTVLSGGSYGVDELGEEWGENQGIPVVSEPYEPDWDKHGRAAGPIRNQKLAQDADACIAVWDGESPGTRSMIEEAFRERLPTHIVNTGAASGVVANDLTEEELVRRLPEISKIESDGVRKKTISFILENCPPYFWTLPTSSSGKYHRPDEGGYRGNHLHTKRVFWMYDNMARTLVEQQYIQEYQIDIGRAAALIHDMFKYGWPPRDGGHTVDYHDVIGAEMVYQYSDLPDEVAALVDAHNGGWHEGMSPKNYHQQMFHFCDMSAARRGVNTSVYEPTEEIEEMSDTLMVDDE